MNSIGIDYDPLPFTGGSIVDVNDKYFDVQVYAIHRFDPIEMRPAYGSKTYEIYQVDPFIGKTSLVSPGILRIPLLKKSLFEKGDSIVARYAFRELGIYGQDSNDFILESINMFTTFGFGVGSLRLKRVEINDFHILPKDYR